MDQQRTGGLPSVTLESTTQQFSYSMTHQGTVDTNSFETHFVLTLLEIDEHKALLTNIAGREVEVLFRHHLSTIVAKDLGRWARRSLGLRGRTAPGVFTQIIWKGQVLGINQPLATLLEDGQPSREALRACTFCRNPLRNDNAPVATCERVAPFYYCYFCGDSPTWHHGWCCPQNPDSMFYKGPTHADRTVEMILDHLGNAVDGID